MGPEMRAARSCDATRTGGPTARGNPAQPGRLKGHGDAGVTTLRRPLHVST